MTAGGSSKTRSRSAAATRARVSAAAARAEAERRERRRGRAQLLAVALVGLVLVAGAALWAARGGTEPGAPETGDLAAVSGRGAEAPPPWPAPADVPARAKAAGLPLGPMGTAEHYHVHLDVLVNGKPVAVPANIGVDETTGSMSYLHTHSPDGLVHIEAGEEGQPFTLGQLFTQWDVRLSSTQLGGLTASDGNQITLYVNGTEFGGDPARLRLRPHQQIALIYGSTGQKVDVPTSYEFPPGV